MPGCVPAKYRNVHGQYGQAPYQEFASNDSWRLVRFGAPAPLCREAVVNERAAFRVNRPSVGLRPIVVHIPHSSPLIPHDVRAQLLPDDAELSRELVRLTDWHTDRLYGLTADLGATQFINGLSRLVVDPERFVDDTEEPMASVGQGVVYVRTTDGKPLRSSDAAGRQALIDRFFVPYHEALTALVADTLETFGRCLILDCHSFATEPLPSEMDQAPDRPDICLGTDPFHTPPALADALRAALAEEGFRVELNRPFAGSIVPLRWYGHDRRVASVMIETRRGIYCDESTGERSGNFYPVAEALGRGVRQALVTSSLL